MAFKDPEVKRLYHKAWRNRNRKKLLFQAKQRRLADPEKFAKRSRLGSRRWRKNNRERWLEHNRKFYRRHRKKRLEQVKSRSQKIRLEVLDHYGKVCRCCGEKRKEFLSIDHIKGGGTEHRNRVGRGQAFYKWLRRKKYPKGYRTLCMNCNWSLGKYGYCPHKKRG